MRLVRLIPIVLLLIPLLGFGRCTRDPSLRCLDAKLDAAADHARAELTCNASAAAQGDAVDDACLAAADLALEEAFTTAEELDGCRTHDDWMRAARNTESLVGRTVEILRPMPDAPSLCVEAKLEASGQWVHDAVRGHRTFLWTSEEAWLSFHFELARWWHAYLFQRAETSGDCQTQGDAEVARRLVDSGLDALYGGLRLIDIDTHQVESEAQPPSTPGSPGVDASIYPKLVAQYGGTDFTLNRATYTRIRHAGARGKPDAILILVPGFEGGGASFKILGENLVGRALEAGLHIEVWAYDRRGQQLEDRAGVALAIEQSDPSIALDWFFGDELGLSLDPALERRAIFHDPHADTAFIAEWTSLVFSRDIDAIVEVARASARHGNVFLGGHSAGTGYTARYAATDFDLTGAGPAEPGFEKVRGLVLLEGGGGSIGSPPDQATLDRIEDRADGGLFHAVRDAAPRCVDGSPCSVANESVDCAGLGNETCTVPTDAYAIVGGLLNTRIFAASEPGAVQGLDDPDSGQVILQVDQGAPGNTAIAAVPDLAVLGLLPQSTAAAALGGFIDDDGLVSSLAPFVRTSVGASGPVVNGLLTWQDIHEGPMPASAVPDNGPAPTALPAGVWGREAEISRLDRVAETFVAAGTNFSDWYYPSSGLSTTSGIGLDSTALSIGRGRRDIENLTQITHVDVPVICFGGTNGLTPVPASYLDFAQSLGECQQGACTGAPRVVDDTLPNPAFPTFGGIDGGFEVHLSEGYAHVDIVTAEDDASNQVIGPLVEFIYRNLED